MKYYVEFKYAGKSYHEWEVLLSIPYQNSPEAILINIIEKSGILIKIDKNLYKFINSSGWTYHLRIRAEDCNIDNLKTEIDWIPIDEKITIEKLNNKFMLIDWNLGLLK